MALVWNCSQSSMTVIGRPVLACSVVWRPLTAPLAQQLVPLSLKGDLSPPHPPTTLYVALVIFCATFEKDSEKPANPNSRYLYYYLLVAITLLCFSCKSCAATVRHRRVMWHWIFQIGISQIFKCAHMASFHWPGHKLQPKNIHNLFVQACNLAMQFHNYVYVCVSSCKLWQSIDTFFASFSPFYKRLEEKGN